MPSSLVRTAVFLVLPIAAGCADVQTGDDDAIPEVGSYTAPVKVLNSKQVKVLGTLAYGGSAGCANCSFANTVSKYRAYKFTGAAGDHLDIWVRSPNGDAQAWLLDASFRILAQNDNAAPGVSDSHLDVTLTDGGSFMIA